MSETIAAKYDDVFKLQQRLVSELLHKKVWSSVAGDTVTAMPNNNCCVAYSKRANYTHVFPVSGNFDSHVREFVKEVKPYV